VHDDIDTEMAHISKNQEPMNVEHFQCSECSHVTTVESIGIVIMGPICPKCKRVMQKMDAEVVRTFNHSRPK
jgi:hypothetical protein